MLVLERRPGTSIRIGDNIHVEIREIRSRSSVKLAIRAPRQIPIVRDELITDQSPTHAPLGTPQGLRVTLVEDNLSHAKLIRHALAENGVRDITLHSTGNDAITSLSPSDQAAPEAVKPNLIFLDYMLPDITGLDILRELRRQDAYRSTPVVMLSVSGQEQHVSQCLASGANAFVVKETGYGQLRDSIARVAEFWTHTRLVA